MKHLIVGIDPGTTTAVAALDLEGEIVDVGSSRDWSVEDVAERVSRLGKPVIFGADKAKPPSFVEKVAALFKAKLVVPEEDLGTEEKKAMAPRYRGHRRDAVAAAVQAYQSYESLFERVEKTIPREKRGAVKAKLVLDEAINRADALRKIEKGEEDDAGKEAKKPRMRKSEAEKEVARLRSENWALKKKVEDLGRTRTKVVKHITDSDLENLAKDRLHTIRALNRKLESLKDENRKLKGELAVWEAGGVPIKDKDIEDVEVKERNGVRYISRKEFSKIERQEAQDLLRKIVDEHRSKRS